MNPGVISGHTTSARILFTGAAAVLALGTVLAGGPGRAAAAPRDTVATAPGTIATVAGGVGGPGKATEVALGPCGVRWQGGSLYVADGPAVRRVAANDQLTTPAGAGVGIGPADSGGLATGSNLDTCSVAADGAGNLLIAEQNHLQVSVVAAKTGSFYGQAMTAGHIYPVAGNGSHGFGKPGAAALSAPLNNPAGVTADSHGNLVIAVSGWGQPKTWARVDVVAAKSGTFYGQAMTAGHLYTVAGGGLNLAGTGDGGPATKAELGQRVGGVRADANGNLVFADSSFDRIRVVAATSGTFYGQAMTAGDIYTIAGNGKDAFGGDGGPATGASISFPEDVAVDASGDLAIADHGNERARFVPATSGTFYGRVMQAGDIYTVAGNGTGGFGGDGGPGTAAELQDPRGVAMDSAGNLAIADNGNGVVRLLAAHTGTFYGQVMTTGDIYTIGGVPADMGVEAFSGDGGPALRAEFDGPDGMTVDPAGDMLIADQQNERIRMVAARSGTFYGQAMTAGDVYTVAGNGTLGYSGDGGPATRAALQFPGGVAVDQSGNLVVADTYNSRIRVVAAKAGTFYGQAMAIGHIYTVAGTGTAGFGGDGGPATSAQVNFPERVTVDPTGNLVISDGFNNRVRVVAARTGTFYGKAMTKGDIYTIAGNGTAGFGGDGGPGTSAELNDQEGVQADAAGNVLIADLFNERIRVVAGSTGTFYGQAMTTGHIYTVAGDGTAGFGGDGGPGTSAELHWPYDATVDSVGNLILADADNNRIRVVAAKAGTFYGVPMTEGNIYTVAGTGVFGFTGDGGPASHADLDFPTAVAATGKGLVVADNRRVRLISG
jgi:trimeric autotransporter adhesin